MNTHIAPASDDTDSGFLAFSEVPILRMSSMLRGRRLQQIISLILEVVMSECIYIQAAASGSLKHQRGNNRPKSKYRPRQNSQDIDRCGVFEKPQTYTPRRPTPP